MIYYLPTGGGGGGVRVVLYSATCDSLHVINIIKIRLFNGRLQSETHESASAFIDIYHRELGFI